jgi:hypothetical protein
MTKFASYFRINKSQAQLDFVDVDTERDLSLFVDPYVFGQRTDIWSLTCHSAINSFFEVILESIRLNNSSRALQLLNKLNEPNETCLGLSSGKPSGRGVGGIQAEAILANFEKSKAAKTGLLADLSDCELFIEGIGPDKISDITTNIIRSELIRYTQAQCNLHGIALQQDVPSGWLWNTQTKKWTEEYVYLPVLNGKKIILIPKASVRWKLGFSHQEYYNDFVLSYLQSEHLSQNTALVETLKNGRQRVTKKSLKEIHPLEKNFLADFSIEHPEVLERYKNLMGVPKVVTDAELDNEFMEDVFAKALAAELVRINAGASEANKFHAFITGVLEFLFYPNLIYPEKEKSINEGRKRLDILYTNNATGGFFFRRRAEQNVQANKIVVECKNYTNEIANPELDQIVGRFAPSRGLLGFLIARSLDNRTKFIKRCKDSVNQRHGYILLFEDSDILEMLNDIARGSRVSIDIKLEKMFDEIIS